MRLEQQIRNRLEKRDILLMTHIVLGYPSFETNRRVVAQMVENGVDCIEMQIPFSEPMADGSVILKANQDSLALGTSVKDCMDFGKEMAEQYDIPFLYMTYYNIVYKYGEERFFSDCKKAGITGLIIPDLPPEMSKQFFALGREQQIATVLIYAPTSTDSRMSELDSIGDGFIYCAARRGVTGKKSEFGEDFNAYLSRCRAATKKPIAVGFGIQNRDDVQALKGRADMAVIGSQTIRLVDEQGPEAVGPFIAGLR
jgi:tryptophan synthase alpha chain